MKATAKKKDWQLKGPLPKCESCALGKAQTTKIPKVNLSNLATHPGNRMMFDLSWIKARSLGGNQYWLLIVDEYTNHAWSYFISAKGDLGNLCGNNTVKQGV